MNFSVGVNSSLSVLVILFLFPCLFGSWRPGGTICIHTRAYETSKSSLPRTPQFQFHVAPMQGYTNAQTRKMFHLLSPSSIKWTEMEKLDDIFPKREPADYLWDALEKRLGAPGNFYDARNNNNDDGANLVLQLGTNDPERLQTCVERTLERYDNNVLREINLNCGCPAIDTGGAPTYGASLMKDAKLTGQLVQAARNGLEQHFQRTSAKHYQFILPQISVKCRIGVFESDQDMRPLDDQDYNSLCEYISTIHENGGHHVILHARPAILSGLSPVKNRIVPTLDYEFVERIASEFEGRVDITLNGGITKVSQLRSLQEQSCTTRSPISSHMAGRWCLRRPLDLIHVEDLLRGEQAQESTSSSPVPLIQTAIEKYVDDSMRTANSGLSQTHTPTIADLCLPLFLITEQLKDDYDYEEEDEIQDDSVTERPSLTYEDIESLYDVVQDGLAQIEDLCSRGKKKKKGSASDMNFKRLSSSFKSMVGTKVANKWKRNRAEL